MRLAPRLVLAFGFLAALSVAGPSYVLREDRREAEQNGFNEDVARVCNNAAAEIERQGTNDRDLVANACKQGELVDQTAMVKSLDEIRISLPTRVKDSRSAFGMDLLTLKVVGGEVIASDPPRADEKATEGLLAGDTTSFLLRAATPPKLPYPAIVTRCIKRDTRAVGLVAFRSLLPVLSRLGDAEKVSVTIGAPATPQDDSGETTCYVDDHVGTKLPIVVQKSRRELREALARIDKTVLYAGLAATAVALLLAVLLARNLGRPLAELATEARKVASGEAHPLQVRGSGEIGELVSAFDKMIEDLAVTRRRLAATSRVAAWREVARRVAHEVKNPLAPIRAAVETLRRLRARSDPAFDEYFDEATRTVLEEVHRIANIVTEFTRFARLPQPRPEEQDLMEIARHVLQLQRANAGKARVDLEVLHVPPRARVDKDQIIQVLTNLVQNALDAVEKKENGVVKVALDTDGPMVTITVSDNGPGIAPEIAARLFEPYATTKTQGTGLGLAIAQRIAMEHNGELSCVAAKGSAGGAVFRLALPVDGPPSSVDAPPSQANV